MKRFDLYRMKNESTPLSEEYFNPIWFDIDSRLDALESIKVSWEEAVRTISQYGIVRIEELIRPAWQHLQTKRQEANTIVNEIRDLRESADEMINAERDEVLSAIANARTSSLNDINSARNNALTEISSKKTDALSSIEQAKQQALSQLDINKLYAISFFFGGE